MKTDDWELERKAPPGLSIEAQEQNESVAWYKKGNERLMICAVGGKNNFDRFFSRDIQRAILNASNDDPFPRIVLVTDRDDRNVEEIEGDIAQKLSPFFAGTKNREWVTNHYKDSFDMEKSIEVLLLVIPVEHQGALENVMLDAISEDPYDKNIVDRCTSFVAELRPKADRYIATDRLQLKANLSTVWAIQSPEKSFDFIDAQIKSVQWEKYKTLDQCFDILKGI
jgi:hypothetical protein